MTSLLEVNELNSGYGTARVLSDVSLSLHQGSSVALLGRNGMGKTTLLRTIIGLARQFSGSIKIAGRDISNLSSERRAGLGIGWVPQERNIFRSLTVTENLTAVATKGPWTPHRIFEMFPRLRERKKNYGGQLSGGEQQMLAIGRALVLNPTILLLDEPTEGLAPIIVDELMKALALLFKDEGMAGIIVEQHAGKILKLTNSAVILERGQIVHSDSSSGLMSKPEILDRYLGVHNASPSH